MTNDFGGLQFGDFVLDVRERRLLRNGRPVPLAPKAFDVLAALAARPGCLVTKDELLNEVWPDSFVEESNLAYHVFALRRALGETADGESYVETVPKRGYRFMASVAAVNGSSGANGEAVLSAATLAPDTGAGQPQAIGLGAAKRSSHDLMSEGPDASGPLATSPGKERGRASRFVGRAAALWFLGGVCGATVAMALLYPRRAPVAREPIRVEVSIGVRLTETGAFAISPDGRHLVFAGAGPDGVLRLWVRSLDASSARPLPGTEVALGASVPPMFWSPDSRFVAFDAIGQLKEVDVTGGAPRTLCTLPTLAVGGSWSQDGVIVVGSPQGGILRCPASGGEASIVTQPDPSRQESAHLLPWFLPDGRRFLYLSVSRAAPEHSGIYVHTLDAPPEATPTRILATGFGAAYVPDVERERGHLLFMRDGALYAQGFDPARLQLTGEAARIAEPVGSFLDGAFFSASRNGVLAFRAPEDTTRLTWLDRRGTVLGRVGDPGRYSGLALAPDETRAVVVQHAIQANADQDLWLVDLPSGRSSRLTADARLEEWPVWSEDGRRIYFTGSGAIGSIFEQSIDGERGGRLLLESPQHKMPTSISRDGRFLLYTSRSSGSTRGDVWVLPLTGERTPYPLIRRAFDQEQAQFSPDGQWVAYTSNDSGRPEVLVRPFAPASTTDAESAGESVMVSKSGGTAPRWRADGKELFFITPVSAIASVPVSVHPVLSVGSPTTLFQAPGIATDWSVAADGSRFLVMAPDVGTTSTSLSLVFNWQETLDNKR
jgi:DNA-binding winged helix-turn-helix (wHTH) protein/Tol biopolymer transport system component